MGHFVLKAPLRGSRNAARKIVPVFSQKSVQNVGFEPVSLANFKSKKRWNRPPRLPNREKYKFQIIWSLLYLVRLLDALSTLNLKLDLSE